MALPKPGTVQQRYVLHMTFDGVSTQVGGVKTQSYRENLLGHRSGGRVKPLAAYSGSQPAATTPRPKDNWEDELRVLGNPANY